MHKKDTGLKVFQKRWDSVHHYSIIISAGSVRDHQQENIEGSLQRPHPTKCDLLRPSGPSRCLGTYKRTVELWRNAVQGKDNARTHKSLAPKLGIRVDEETGGSRLDLSFQRLLCHAACFCLSLRLRCCPSLELKAALSPLPSSWTESRGPFAAPPVLSPPALPLLTQNDPSDPFQRSNYITRNGAVSPPQPPNPPPR